MSRSEYRVKVEQPWDGLVSVEGQTQEGCVVNTVILFRVSGGKGEGKGGLVCWEDLRESLMQSAHQLGTSALLQAHSLLSQDSTVLAG